MRQVTTDQRLKLINNAAVALDFLFKEVPGEEKQSIFADIKATIDTIDPASTTTPADAVNALANVLEVTAEISGNQKFESVADIIAKLAGVVDGKERLLPAAIDIWSDVRHLEKTTPSALTYGPDVHFQAPTEAVQYSA